MITTLIILRILVKAKIIKQNSVFHPDFLLAKAKRAVTYCKIRTILSSNRQSINLAK